MSRSDDPPFPPRNGHGLPPADPHLRAALRHAPDHAVEPPAALSAAVIGAARAALHSERASPPPASTRVGWWQHAAGRWRAASGAGPGPRAAIAGQRVAGIVGVMWRFDPPPAAREPTNAPATSPDAAHDRPDRPAPEVSAARPPAARPGAELRKEASPPASPGPSPPAPPPAPPAAPAPAPSPVPSPRAAAPAHRAATDPKTTNVDAATDSTPNVPADRAARAGQAGHEAATLEALAAARGAAQRTARAPAAAPVQTIEAAADPLSGVVAAVADAGSSAQAWWNMLRGATAGRWVPAPKAAKAETAAAAAPDDGDAVRSPDGAVLGWLRFDADGVTWLAATAGEPVRRWRAPLADAELRRQLQATRPR
jgi:hypothetical protein